MQTYGAIVYCFMRQYSFYFDIQSVRAWLHACMHDPGCPGPDQDGMIWMYWNTSLHGLKQKFKQWLKWLKCYQKDLVAKEDYHWTTLRLQLYTIIFEHNLSRSVTSFKERDFFQYIKIFPPSSRRNHVKETLSRHSICPPPLPYWGVWIYNEGGVFHLKFSCRVGYSKTPHIRTQIFQVSLNRFLCKWCLPAN